MTVTSTPSRTPLFLAEPPVGTDGRPALRRLLIANRGEIACRVIATCRKLNITSIAVYVDEDSSSLHVQQADESIRIGSIVRSAKNPFLDGALLVATARDARADAIHPGYGYLSEDAAFAQLVRDAGLTFVGPGAAAMSTLGNKRAAKAYLAERAPDVPLIPGFAGSSQNAAELEAAVESQRIGYPVMLKAAAGGGGKGMRVVRARGELRDALERARSEAERSFGSADCIVERFVEAAKHVEMQVLGDRHGRVVCLWERDCSVQRRHQKIVEETPCAWLPEPMRRSMAAAAVRIARLIGYEGAGTVEFVVDVAAREFYFLEVNARLQVEHPITEELTGLDLVALQLFVAAGGSLATLPALDAVPRNGHAIECRLCAEDPGRDFLPERGTIRLWHPAPDSDARFETAIQTGSDVSIYFDPMVAKIVVWAPTRLLAIEKMTRTLAQTACVGVRTNQLFLQSCLSHPAFRDPAFTTSFIPSNLQSLLRNPYVEEGKGLGDLSRVAPCLLLRHIRARRTRPFSHIRRGFRNQRCDPVNQHANVVVELKGAASTASTGTERQQQPSICILQPATPDERGQGTYRFHFAPIPPRPDDGSQKASSTETKAKKVTAQYNALSSAIRSRQVTNSPPSTAVIHSVVEIPPPPNSPSSPSSSSSSSSSQSSSNWKSVAVSMSIDGQKMRAHLTTTDRNDDYDSTAATPQTVWAHFPALGTWAAYEVHSVLSWAESLREVADEGGKAAEETSKIVKAPMPCRVLGVLKENGQEVKGGENAMVVESMKMEMNIVVPADGKFYSDWKKGDAVTDGDVLCRIE